MEETTQKRAKRILAELTKAYPGALVLDLDGRGLHFLAEVEPVQDHPEYDRAIEVIIASKPHKHLKTRQTYTIVSGNLTLHVGDNIIQLKKGDTYEIPLNTIHYATSDDECWVDIYSKPGWTKEDHIFV